MPIKKILSHPHRDTGLVILFLVIGASISFIFDHFRWQELLGIGAVICTFEHWKTTRQLAESQSQKLKTHGFTSVKCFRMASVYALFRQTFWILYYICITAYIPIAGALFFISYPLWSKKIDTFVQKDITQEKISWKIYLKEMWDEWLDGPHMWQYEVLLVGILLIINLMIFDLRWQEWVAVIAIIFTFMHGQVARYLSEAEMIEYHSGSRIFQKRSSSHKESFFYLAKEIMWFAYFISLGAYTAILGTVLFIIYPFWRTFYRKYI